MGILNSLDFFAILPRPKIQRLILRPRYYQISNGVIKDRNCILMFRELRDFLFATDTPHNCLAIPRAWYKMIGVDKRQRIDITIMLDHPNRRTVNIIPNNLPVNESCDCEQSLSRLERIYLDAKHIFFNGIAWHFMLQLPVLVGEEVDFLITAACDEELLWEIQGAQVPAVAYVVFAQFVHWFFEIWNVFKLNDKVTSDKEYNGSFVLWSGLNCFVTKNHSFISLESSHLNQSFPLMMKPPSDATSVSVKQSYV